MNKLNKNIEIYLMGVFSFIFFAISMYSSYCFIELSSVSKMVRMMCLIVSIVFFIALEKKIIDNKSSYPEIYDQLLEINVACVIILVPIVFRYGKVFLHDNNTYYSAFLFGYFLVFLSAPILDILNAGGFIRRKIAKFDNSTMWFIFLVAILFGMSLREKNYYLWDIGTLFKNIDRRSVYSLFNLAELSFAKHISYAFVGVATIFKIGFDSTVIGYAVLSRALMIAGAYGIWKLLHHMYYGKMEWTYFLCTFAYCASPYLLGQMTDLYLDSASWYLFPLVAYFIYSRKWVLSFAASILFVFTKETNVISYSFFILGIYIVEALEKRKIIHGIIKYICLLLPSIFWLLSYLFVFHVTNQGNIEFSKGFALGKIHSLLYLNFNWVYFVLSLVGFVLVLLVKKYNEYFKWIFPIFMSMMAFFLSSLVIITGVIHSRYIDAMIVQIYIMGAFVFLIVFDDLKVLQLVALGVQIAVLFASNYYYLDPLTRATYNKINVGNLDIYYYQEYLSDGWSNNAQHQNWGAVLDMALDDVVDNKDINIFMPANPGNSTWMFDAMGKYIFLDNTDEIVLQEYWDNNHNSRIADSDKSEIIDVHIIVDDYSFEAVHGQCCYLLYTDYSGKEIADRIKAEKEIIYEKSFEKSGWIVNGILFWA